MIFSSSIFLIFIIFFFCVYFFLNSFARKWFILISSYIFYGWWDVRYLALIILSTFVDYFCSRCMESAPTEGKRKIFLWISIIVNLGILFIFKYFNFFSDSLLQLAQLFGWKLSFIELHVLLPVGISFYTFQSMGYTIDVFKKKIKAEKNLLVFSCYVAYFPQLVAGPIERAEHLIGQLRNVVDPTIQQVKSGIGLIIWGYFLKVFIADNLARMVDIHFMIGRESVRFLLSNPKDEFVLYNPMVQWFLQSNNLHLTAPEIILVVFAFGLQIYADFYGYSSIARGLGRVMGIEIIRNFRQPYFATSPSDFWRRWHISLSTWLRDYLYIPMGGSRKGVFHTLRNLGIVGLLGILFYGERIMVYYLLSDMFWDFSKFLRKNQIGYLRLFQ